MIRVYFVGPTMTDALRRGAFTNFADASDWLLNDGASHKMYSVEIYPSDLKEITR